MSLDPTTSEGTSSTEGLVLSYGSLLLMSLLPIVLGSWRTVRQRNAAAMPVDNNKAFAGSTSSSGRHHHHHQHHNHNHQQHHPKRHSNSTPNSDSDDAHLSPAAPPPTVVESAPKSGDLLRLALHATVIVLFSCLVSKCFSRTVIVLGVKVYAYVLGALALAHSISPICHLLVPSSVPNVPFHVLFIKGEGAHRRSLINYKFTTYDIICLLLSVGIGVWYVLQKHWIPNNMLGLACSISSIEILQLNNVVTGYIMMTIYYLDTVCFTVGQQFWQSLANTLDLPILLMFPKSIITTTSGGGSAAAAASSGPEFALLDVADIVIPGIFLALMLRFDQAMQRKLNVYFYATLLGYVCGIFLASTVLILFRQMYTTTGFVVPCCLVPPALVALRLGDLKMFFSYDDAVVVVVAGGTMSSATSADDDGGGGAKKSNNERFGSEMATPRVSETTTRSRRS